MATALAPAREDLAAIDGVVSVIDPLALPDGAANPAAAPLVAQHGDGFLVVVELAPDLSAQEQDTALDEVEARLLEIPAELEEAAGGEVTGIVGGTTLIVEAITGRSRRTWAPVNPSPCRSPADDGAGLRGLPRRRNADRWRGRVHRRWAGGAAGLLLRLDLDSAVVNMVTVLGLGLSSTRAC